MSSTGQKSCPIGHHVSSTGQKSCPIGHRVSSTGQQKCPVPEWYTYIQTHTANQLF